MSRVIFILSLGLCHIYIYIYIYIHTLVYTTIQGTSLIWYGHLSDPKIPLNHFFKQRKNLGQYGKNTSLTHT